MPRSLTIDDLNSRLAEVEHERHVTEMNSSLRIAQLMGAADMLRSLMTALDDADGPEVPVNGILTGPQDDAF